MDAFRRFIRSIEAGGTLIYCAEDQLLSKLVQEEGDGLEPIPYGTLSYREEEGGCTLRSEHGTFPLKVFGEHNVQNIAGAMEVCRTLDISEKEFLEAIQDFEGASLRLDTLYENGRNIAFRDYAHAPSKVRATVDAVRGRFPERSLAAVLELHTYSSLDPAFIDEYRDSMKGAERGFILFDPEAAKRKGFAPLDPERVRAAFGDPSLSVHTDMEELEADLLDTSGLGEKEGQVLLFMSSGPFQKADLASMSERILAPAQE